MVERREAEVDSDKAYLKDLVAMIANRLVVPKGAVLYALIVTMGDSRNPILIYSHDQLPIPAVDSIYEAIGNGLHYFGKVTRVTTTVSHTGISINMASQIELVEA